MKVFAITCLLATLAISSSNAYRTNDFVSSVLDNQKVEGLLETVQGLLQSPQTVEEEPSKKGAYALVKFIVTPTKAKGFIEAFEKSKEAAVKYDGYEGYYLVKTIDDNITYISWSAWKSIQDLADYLKSGDAKTLIEYTAKEDIVTFISGVKPIA